MFCGIRLLCSLFRKSIIKLSTSTLIYFSESIDSSRSFSSGAIAGTVITVVLVAVSIPVIVLILILFVRWRRRRVNRADDSDSGSIDASAPSQPKVYKRLRDLGNTELKQLGIALGLKYAHINRMAEEALCNRIIQAWLRKDDDVLKISGKPSWEGLTKALEDIGMKGIADDIRRAEKLKVSYELY